MCAPASTRNKTETVNRRRSIHEFALYRRRLLRYIRIDWSRIYARSSEQNGLLRIGLETEYRTDTRRLSLETYARFRSGKRYGRRARVVTVLGTVTAETAVKTTSWNGLRIHETPDVSGARTYIYYAFRRFDYAICFFRKFSLPHPPNLPLVFFRRLLSFRQCIETVKTFRA